MPIAEPTKGRCLYPIGDPVLRPDEFRWCDAMRTHEAYCDEHQGITRIRGNKSVRSSDLHDFTMTKTNRKATDDYLERK